MNRSQPARFAAAVAAAVAFTLPAGDALAQDAAKRLNVVWIVAEDLSPTLGCWGDPHAITPNLDRLASQGARFTRCFTHAPVCAPSRSGLITGMYPTSIGSHHMRSKLIKPPELFPGFLRKAGWFTAWPGKTDFNFDQPKDWVDSVQDWTKAPELLPRDKPFFAYINIQVSHEGQIRVGKEALAKNLAKLKANEFHDPAKMPLPPYYPDTPEVRRDVANYYDLVTAMDYRVGEILELLEKRGLADNTVVFFFGDHGWGMPRGKRWCYDSGTRAPLIIRWPGTIKPGTVREDLVAFVDFAPTVLSIIGADIPVHLQGRAFLGSKQAPERKYAFSARDRMDETYDRIRAVRDARFRYLRNFHPELPYAQHINYMNLMPTMQTWRRLAAAGRLEGPQKLFFSPAKPAEELYDTQTDPHEINNLAGSPAHAEKLKELRAALDKWMADTKDLGGEPETELIKRGLVRNVLDEYEKRKKEHPKP